MKQQSFSVRCKWTHISPNPLFQILPFLQALCHVFLSQCLGTHSCPTSFRCINGDVMTDVIIVMGIRMQNHQCNEVENAFPIFKVSRLVRVHTDSHHNGHNKMIFAVSDVWLFTCLGFKCRLICGFLIPDYYTVIIFIAIIFPYFRILYFTVFPSLFSSYLRIWITGSNGKKVQNREVSNHAFFCNPETIATLYQCIKPSL